MKRLLILLLAVVSLLWSCDKENGPTEPEPELQTARYADYIWFDTSSYLITVQQSGSAEPYIDGDRIIGEPFTDVNGNGVYDSGIDIFIRCATCDSNQDLNRNGRHDGPNDPYTAGTPFDDYDGDRIFDPPNFLYDSGEPYRDLNDDGQWAGVGDFDISPVFLRIEKAGGDTLRFYRRDSTYIFCSDSGYCEYWPASSAATWDLVEEYYRHLLWFDFLRPETSSIFIDKNEDAELPVVKGATLVEGTDSDSAWFGQLQEYVKFNRTVAFDQELVVGPDTLTGLLMVELDELVYSGINHPLYFYRFWWNKELGFVGFEKKFSGTELRVLILEHHDSIPLPMTPTGG